MLYKKYISNIKNKRVLILGATPELRDLVIRFGYISISIDINKEFSYKLIEQMKYKNNENNIILKDSWLNIDKNF